MIKIAINGFGRIGRSAARIILDTPNLELVAINDIIDLKDFYYYFKYDSIYKELKDKISLHDNYLLVDQKKIYLFNKKDPRELNLKDLDVDVLLECSGVFLTSNSLRYHVENGIKKIIISAPPKDDTKMYIMYHNHKEYKNEKIVSNSSCSANAIVPIFDIIDKHLSIKGAFITTIHSYTTDQSLLDTKYSRSAPNNIIPVDSSAAKTTEKFFPHLKDKLYSKSLRIPLPATTIYDLNIKIDKKVSKKELHELIEKNLSKTFNTTNSPLVSSDFIKDSYSATIDLNLTQIDQNLIKIILYQDNEFGYAKRLIDLTRYITGVRV